MQFDDLNSRLFFYLAHLKILKTHSFLLVKENRLLITPSHYEVLINFGPKYIAFEKHPDVDDLIKVKKNNIAFYKKILNYKRYFKFNRFTRLIRFKYNSFFSRMLNPHTKRHTKLARTFFSYAHSSFTAYHDSFFNNWTFLTGFLIPEYAFMFIKVKTWIHKKLELKILKNNKKFYNNRILNTKAKYAKTLSNKDNFIWALHDTPFFYKKKLAHSYSGLVKRAKVIFTPTPRNSSNRIHSRPYLFLNTPRSSLHAAYSYNPLLYVYYKSCLKVFKFFKKFRYTSKFWRAVWFKELRSFYSPRFLSARAGLFKKKIRIKKTVRFLRLFKNRNSSLPEFIKFNVVRKKFKSRKFFIFSKKKSHHVLYQISKFKKLFYKKTVHSSLLRLLKFKKILIISIRATNTIRILNLTNESRIFKKKYRKLNFRGHTYKKYFRYFRKLKRLFLWSSLNFTSKKVKKFNFLALKSYRQLGSFFNNALLPFPPAFKRTFFLPSADSLAKEYTDIGMPAERSLEYSNTYLFVRKPIMRSRFRTNFILQSPGFLMLSSNLVWTLKPTSDYRSSLFRKALYSFLDKNEFHRFILKRYIKIKIFPLNGDTHSSLDGALSTDLSSLPSFLTTFADGLKPVSGFGSFFFEGAATESWTSFTTFNDYLDSIHDYSYNIKRVRFKPGYMTIWRQARTSLKQALFLNFRYQRKLTRYLIRFNKTFRCKLYLHFEARLSNIILRSRLLPDSSSISLFIKNGLVSINGYSCKIENFLTLRGDFIQLVISIKYYIAMRWLQNWVNKKQIRLKKKLKSKLAPNLPFEDKKKNWKLPNWLLFNNHILEDSPKYFEIDFMTLSLFILYDPFLWTDLNPTMFAGTRFGVINLYNWKYIT